MSLLSTSAAALPTAAGVGYAWIPYALAGLALIALGIIVLIRTRLRTRDEARPSLVEYLIVRGAVLVLLGVTAALLADAAAEGDGLTGIDLPTWNWLIAHRTGALTTASMVITTVGSTAVMGVIAVVTAGLLAWRRRRLGDAALVAAVAAGAGLLIAVAKPIIGRIRPPEQYRLVTETNQSFPSGHATASIAILGVIAVVFLPEIRSRALRIGAVGLAVAFIVMIGVSRLYLGVHWPTDIIGGWLSGGALLLLCLTVRGAGRRYPVVVELGRRTATALRRCGPRLDRHPPAVTTGEGATR